MTYAEAMQMIFECFHKVDPRINVRVGGFAYRLAEEVAKTFIAHAETKKLPRKGMAEVDDSGLPTWDDSLEVRKTKLWAIFDAEAREVLGVSRNEAIAQLDAGKLRGTVIEGEFRSLLRLLDPTR